MGGGGREEGKKRKRGVGKEREREREGGREGGRDEERERKEEEEIWIKSLLPFPPSPPSPSIPTLLWVREPKHVVVAKNDSGASLQLLWLCEETTVDERLALGVGDDGDCAWRGEGGGGGGGSVGEERGGEGREKQMEMWVLTGGH